MIVLLLAERPFHEISAISRKLQGLMTAQGQKRWFAFKTSATIAPEMKISVETRSWHYYVSSTDDVVAP
ncbi:hypothetical protein [Halomonas sp. BC04]|uniref:hypothetical protein n=1 Tax=Halomonas sp. BC04 TaxID=1403540 RepID=UPI0003ED82A5|nr:hypothetical protein [Halomonas sp. BC04]EWH02362.1 hypothetical protein Q427_09180 [Halomonas sp. BC04]